jgi:SpoVK/Ycf46/Vps4 family AAA+-type ATPase
MSLLRELQKFQNHYRRDDLSEILRLCDTAFAKIRIEPSASITAAVRPMPLPRRKESISVEIKEFSDLVKLVKTCGPQFRTDTDYNIDLAALLRIQEELEQLDAMIGLKNFKNSVLDQILYFVQNLHVDGKDSDFLHTILCGPPGTGKTEVAKILGKLYSKIGILRAATFKKVTRSDLIGGFLGQTALKTSKVIQDALGGCLFIDEAYSLASPTTSAGSSTDSYSKECLDTLCEALSDNKANLMVIIAGYEADLADTIFKANRGLESRFIWRFVLDNYSAADLMEIFLKKVRDNGWTLDQTLLGVAWFEKHKAEFPHFGRDMELLFSYTKCCHGRRIYGKPDAVRRVLVLEDVNQGLKMLLQNRRQKETFQIPGFYV